MSPGDANDAIAMGIEALDDEALDAAVRRLVAAGIATTEVDDAAALAARRVGRLVRVSAPWGTDVELVTGLAEADHAFSSPLVPGGFHTHGVGFGHVVFATMAFDEAHAFLTGGLGFGQSDWLEMEIAPPLPPIQAGVIEAGTAAAGELFLQGRIGETRFDDIHGAGWRLITTDRAATDPDATEPDHPARSWFTGIGGAVVAVDSPDYRRWFAERGVTWALQRPDFHVFGTATNAREAGELLAALEACLTRPGSGTAAPDHVVENRVIENRSTR